MMQARVFLHLDSPALRIDQNPTVEPKRLFRFLQWNHWSIFDPQVFLLSSSRSLALAVDNFPGKTLIGLRGFGTFTVENTVLSNSRSSILQ
jgi:hypothetical protein